MKINEYFRDFVKDFLGACGFITIISAILLDVITKETVITSMFWQVILGASIYTLLKFAFVNKYDFQKNFQLINFFIFSTLADIMVILWLCLFSPSKIIDKSLIIIYVVAILGAKAFVYSMMHINSRAQARQINEKLNEYKNSSNK